ncbi:MAG: LamG-like jellyroll fold domain-containing protein, partial [Bacteroidota bacterium]
MNKLIFLLLILISPALYSQEFQQNLIAWWNFDDSTAADMSGHNYHGLLVNTPVPVKGIQNTAMRFEGVGFEGDRGDYVKLPRIPFDQMQEFTITMWVCHEDVSYNGGIGYFFYGNHSIGWLGILNHIDPDKPSWQLNLQFATGSAYNYLIYPLFYAFDYHTKSRWVFYAMTVANGKMTAYVDGSQVGQLDQPVSVAEQTNNVATNSACLACHYWNAYSSKHIATRFFGMIDDVRIYNKALT